MNRLLSTTIAALIAAGASGVALAEKPVKDTSVTPATPTTATDTTADDSYNHGDAVSQAAKDAQMDRTAPPASPPGQAVREVAQTQGDFMQFDADKNGTLSREELAAETDLTTNFGTLDTDGDGILSRTEFNGSLELGDADDDMEDEE